MRSDPAEALCLACGLCCNGAIFRDVKLTTGDNAVSLRKLGLSFKRTGPGFAMRQPCTAFHGGKCGVYEDRPVHCRTFECVTLKRLLNRDLESATAHKLVKRARRDVGSVNRLLTELGDHDKTASLQARFQETMKRCGSHPLTAIQAEALSRLTISMHKLNLLLSREFYPNAVNQV